MALVASPSLLAVLGVGCGNSSGDAPADADASVPDGSPITVNGSCPATIQAFPKLKSPHIAIGTEVEYNSNPPSSGPHYPIWPAFQEFTKPLDRRYYVHDLEHGAIVFLYKCTKPQGCPEIAAQLKMVVGSLPEDFLCDVAIRVRAVITPDPFLDVPVAAAAWGWTYKASCVDAPSLIEFAKAHYAQGPENFCDNGQKEF